VETNTGLTNWLRLAAFYDTFQDAIGGNRLRKWFIKTHVRASPGEKIVDIGCGPGQILPWLPPVNYIGFDVNRNYIASANEKYGDRATFVVGDTEVVWNDQRFHAADIIIGLGILHHLDDEAALHCIKFAHRCLKQGGRFVCLEACWVPNQGFVSRYVMSRDRGQHIRTEQSYRDLIQKFFEAPKVWIQRRPMRVPYVTVVFECEKCARP
jgi:ubiquinone/menaquinone biosynthesis C-methylase UbiE